MKSIVSVAMKAGTRSNVTSTPLISPMDGAEHKAARIAGPTPMIVVVGIEDVGEGDADQPEGGADREVEILVGDDEGHADGHDGIARAVAQQRLEGVERAEEIRVDEGARR